MELLLLIIGIPIALFVVYRIFWTLSIGGRAIAIGLALGNLFFLYGVRILDWGSYRSNYWITICENCGYKLY